MGGNGSNEGDVLIDDMAPVCDEEWEMKDALVICRQMNYSFVSYLTRNSKFSNFTADSGLSLVCSGTENTISECFRKENVPCSEENHAGLTCSNKGKSRIRVILFSYYLFKFRQ